MRILSIRAQGYRSLRDVSWGEVSPPGRKLGTKVVIFGQNAVGKSNLLRLLDLLLVRAPRTEQPDALGRIHVPDEPAAIHLANPSEPARVTIVLDQELRSARTQIEMLPQDPSDAVLQQVVEPLRMASAGKERGQVEYSCTIYAERSGVNVHVDHVRVNGDIWISDGRIAWLQQAASEGQKPVFLYPTDRDQPILVALTEGFVRVDCPRVLHPHEARIRPPLAKLDDHSKQKEEDARIRQFANPWLEIPDDNLVNRLHAIDREPTLAKSFDHLRKHLVRSHGRLGIRSLWQNADELLDLVLSDLPELQRGAAERSYIPARFRGTGFVQMLYVLAACYLSGASAIGIEELEVNLAPDTQRELWRWLGDQIREGGLLEQVLVTSHSPIFLQGDGHQGDLDVWYAKLDAEKGTLLERLGEGDHVQLALRQHFGPMEGPLWSLEAVPWNPPQSEDDRFECMYLGSDKYEGPFVLATFQGLLEATREKPDAELVLVKAQRLSVSRLPDLFDALSLRKWVHEGREPRVLRVEWIEAGTGNAERTIRVEGRPPAEDEEQAQKLIIYVEERIRRGQLDAERGGKFWAELTANLEKRISTIQEGLSGH